MAIGAAAARRSAAKELAASDGRRIEALMLSPVPTTPFVRRVVAEQGEEYRVGPFRWLENPRVEPGAQRKIEKGGRSGLG